MEDNRKILKGDKYIWGTYFFLCLISIISMYSASGMLTMKSGEIYDPIIRHAIFLIISTLIVFAVHYVHYKWLRLFGLPLFAIAAVLLLYTLFFAEKVNDAARWITIAGIPIQPSEIAKLDVETLARAIYPVGFYQNKAEQIINLSKEIIKYRLRYTQILSDTAPELYSGISGEKETLKISYNSTIPTSAEVDDIKKILKLARKEDVFKGVTSVGPHRDDLELSLNGNTLKSFGSQGQKRSVCLTLKLSEAKVINKIAGEYPVALLDDVMSELDKSRQDFILNHIKDWQVFITCCDPSNIKGLEKGTVFQMEGGNFCNITVK